MHMSFFFSLLFSSTQTCVPVPVPVPEFNMVCSGDPSFPRLLLLPLPHHQRLAGGWTRQGLGSQIKLRLAVMQPPRRPLTF